MTKISIKAIMAQPNYLLCITTSGDVYPVNDPKMMDWIMNQALPVFTKNPDSILELNPDKIEKSVLTDAEGNVITISDSCITKGDDSYQLNASSLIKFINYADKNHYLQGMNTLVDRIIKVLDKKDASSGSIKDLLLFLEKNELPITIDGNILAFKVFTHSDSNGYFKDCHTNLIRQTIGDVVQMDKSKIDLNREKHCSYGLHVCSAAYIPHFYSSLRTLCLVKVRPEDICAVPTDTNAKVRCCRYQILGVIPSSEVQSVLEHNLESAPFFSRLLTLAINEQFTGVNHVVSLLAPKITSLTQISTVCESTFNCTHKKLDVEIESLVENESCNQYLELHEVLNAIKLITEIPEVIQDKKLLKKIKKLRKYYTWKNLGANDAIRLRITRAWKKYDI